MTKSLGLILIIHLLDRSALRVPVEAYVPDGHSVHTDKPARAHHINNSCLFYPLPVPVCPALLCLSVSVPIRVWWDFRVVPLL